MYKVTLEWHFTAFEPAYNTNRILIADADNGEVIQGYYKEATNSYHRWLDDKQVNAVAWIEMPIFDFIKFFRM